MRFPTSARRHPKDAPAWRRCRIPSAAFRSRAWPRPAPSAHAVLRAPAEARRCLRGLPAARPEYVPAAAQDCRARWRDRSPAAWLPALSQLICPNELPWVTPVVSRQLSVASGQLNLGYSLALRKISKAENLWRLLSDRQHLANDALQVGRFRHIQQDRRVERLATLFQNAHSAARVSSGRAQHCQELNHPVLLNVPETAYLK